MDSVTLVRWPAEADRLEALRVAGSPRLLLVDHDAAPPGTRRFAYYIDVHDVDRLYAELKPKLDLLPAGDIHGPADKPYGQRELLLLAPDGNLLAVGHAIDKRYTPTGDSRM